MKKWMYNVLLVVFVLVFIGSGVVVGTYCWESYVQQSRYEELAQMRPTTNVRPQPTQETTPETTPEMTVPDSSPETRPTEAQPTYVEVTDPKTGKKRQILAEFAELYQMNSDIVGWISIPCINVDYPVMQTPDDLEYYLRRDFDKKKSTRGCLFAETACDILAPSDNITIYGHRMSDGTMFGQLNKFRKASFRDQNPYIYFDSLTELHTYEIMSVFLTTASVGKGFAYHTFVNAETEEEFDAFVSQCKKLDLYETGVTAEFGDKLITLSTCDYSRTNGRLVVVAKRVA